MSHLRTILGVSRASIGLGAWLFPGVAMRVFGMDLRHGERFVARVFGAREFALAAALLAAPRAAVAPVAAIGAAVDVADALSGFDERRRGNLSVYSTILGPAGALLFAVMGAQVLRETKADAA